MKKVLFLLLIIFSFSKADYLIYGYQNNNFNSICVKSYSFNNQYLNVTLSSNNSSFSYNLSDFSSFDILPDYEYINNLCVPNDTKNTADTLYLPYDEFSYLMALWGILLSPAIFYGFLTVV